MNLPKLRSNPFFFINSLSDDLCNTPFRTGIAAGSPVPEELMRQLIDKLNLTGLTIAYGMSKFFSIPGPGVP